VNSQASAPPIVLVHGLRLTPRSWEGRKERFESRGHQLLAPAWPRMQGEVEHARRDCALNGWGVREIVDHYAGVIRALERAPVIMGHSFGGLVTELLLDRGLGAAGVAISPAPDKGVLRLPPAELRSGFPVLRNPPLIIGNDKDHTVPASVSKEAAQRLGKSKAVVDYKEFAGRPHFTAGAPGWEKVADYALDWANRRTGASADGKAPATA
jgi:pimeloyl-ACP methyl ester carboxylesterase